MQLASFNTSASLCNMVKSYDRVLQSASQNLHVVPLGKHSPFSMIIFAMAAVSIFKVCIHFF